MFRGAEKLLRIARKTPNEHPTLIVVADGRTHRGNGDNTAGGVFNRITAKNVTRVPIKTIRTGMRNGRGSTERRLRSTVERPEDYDV